MSETGCELDIARKFSAIENALGRVFWRLHVPNVSYKNFSESQKIISTHISNDVRSSILPLNVLLWVASFFSALYITNAYQSGVNLVPIIPVIITALAFSILRIGYRRAAFKSLHAANNQPCDLIFGEGGVLLLSNSCAQLFPWKNMLTSFKGQYGQYLITNHFVVVILPEVVISQQPDPDALLNLIEQKISHSITK
jgi:hypothetical protein